MTNEQDHHPQPEQPTEPQVHVWSGAAAMGDNSTAVGQDAINIQNSNISGTVVSGQNNTVTINQAPTTPPLTPREKRNRQNYLNNLYTARIEGVLHKSLYTEVLLELGKEYKPDAVSRTWGVVLKQEGEPDEEIPPDMTAYEIFVKHGRSLLILGEPGSGKSTVLLQLAEQLIEEARQDDTRPMPLVVNLSSWAREQLPLSSWLVKQMQLPYQVPLKLGQSWIDQHQFVLLLDGFDEVAAEARQACVKAINEYQEKYQTEIVVCARTKTYEQLEQKLNLTNAIGLQPLSMTQIDQYLGALGPNRQTVQALLQHDKQLQELARTPLMLEVIALVYQAGDQQQPAPMETLEMRRKHLLEQYISAMFQRKSRSSVKYSRNGAFKLIKLIAYHMKRNMESELFLENIQPDWLTKPLRQKYSTRVSLLTIAFVMFLGALVPLIYVGLNGVGDTTLRVIIGIVVVSGIIGGLKIDVGKITIVDHVEINFRPRFYSQLMRAYLPKWFREVESEHPDMITNVHLAVIGGLLALLVGVYSEFLGGRIFGAFIDSWEILLFLMAYVVLSPILDLSRTLLSTYTPKISSERAVPNQHIKKSFQSGLSMWLVFTLWTAFAGVLATVFIGAFILANTEMRVTEVGWMSIIGLLSSIAWSSAIIGGFLNHGGMVYTQHSILRSLLKRHYRLPYDKVLVPFLDDLVKRDLLNRVGGGWMFKHRLLQEYFAEQFDPADYERKKRP